MKRILICGLALMILVLVCAAAFAEQAGESYPVAITVKKNVNLREQATKSSKSLKKLPKGEKVVVLSEEQAGKEVWYQVRYENIRGYIRSDLLQIVEGEYAIGMDEFISGGTSGDLYGLATSKLSTRTGPGTDYEDAGTYSVKGQYIKVLSRAYDESNGIWWVKCEIPYGNELRVLWTGYKRFDRNTLSLESIPIEGDESDIPMITPLPPENTTSSPSLEVTATSLPQDNGSDADPLDGYYERGSMSGEEDHDYIPVRVYADREIYHAGEPIVFSADILGGTPPFSIHWSAEESMTRDGSTPLDQYSDTHDDYVSWKNETTNERHAEFVFSPPVDSTTIFGLFDVTDAKGISNLAPYEDCVAVSSIYDDEPAATNEPSTDDMPETEPEQPVQNGSSGAETAVKGLYVIETATEWKQNGKTDYPSRYKREQSDSFPDDFGSNPDYWPQGRDEQGIEHPYSNKRVYIGEVGTIPREICSFRIYETVFHICVPEVPPAFMQYADENGYSILKMYAEGERFDDEMMTQAMFSDGICLYTDSVYLDTLYGKKTELTRESWRVALIPNNISTDSGIVDILSQFIFAGKQLQYSGWRYTNDFYLVTNMAIGTMNFTYWQNMFDISENDSITYTPTSMQMSEEEARWFVNFMKERNKYYGESIHDVIADPDFTGK